MNKYFLLTTDVETTSIVNHRLSDETGRLVANEAIPKILDIYKKYNICSTFFVTGYFAENFPQAVKLIYKNGHEIGCHGYSHEHTVGFDILDYEQQREHLIRAKKILEDIISNEVISFRSPALRTNKFTVKALEETGFKIDSSVASQRFDFFFSLGSKEKLNWLKAPRKTYITSEKYLYSSGDSSIWEIPLSAIIIPYIGATMRLFPQLIKIVRFFLHSEVLRKGNAINFLIHPIEFVSETSYNSKITRRSQNYLIYLLRDKYKSYLKKRNLGDKGTKLLIDQIRYFTRRNYDFISCKEYIERIINENTNRNY